MDRSDVRNELYAPFYLRVRELIREPKMRSWWRSQCEFWYTEEYQEGIYPWPFEHDPDEHPITTAGKYTLFAAIHDVFDESKQPIVIAELDRRKKAKMSSKKNLRAIVFACLLVAVRDLMSREEKEKLLLRKVDDKTELAVLRSYWKDIKRDLGKSVALKPTAAKTSRRPAGRKKADYRTVQDEARIAGKWTRARDRHVYKGEFAKQEGLSLKELEKLLNRVRKRKGRSEK